MNCAQAFPVLLISLFSAVVAQDTLGPISLRDCMTVALSKSPYTVRQRSNRAAAATDVSIAYGQLAPQLSISTDYSRTGPEDQVVFLSGTGGIFPQIGAGTNATTSLNIAGDLINVSTLAGIGQAKAAERQAQERFRAARADFLFNVKQAFYSLLQQMKELNLSRATVIQNREYVEMAQERFRLGALSRPDLLPFEVTLSQSLTDRATADANVITARQSLAGLLGIAPSFRIDTTLAFPDTAGFRVNEDSLIAAAEKKNPQYREADAQIQVLRKQRLSIIGQRLPVLSAGYSYGFTDTTFLGGIGRSQTNFWNVQAVLRWNFLDGTFFPVLRRAGEDLRSAQAGRTIARNSARQEMRQAIANLRAATEALNTIDDLLSQAQEDFRLQREKNRLGAAVVLDVLASQVRYREAQIRATQVIIDYYLAQAEIKRILGQW